MQALGGGVEPAVERQRVARGRAAQRVEIGALRDEVAPGQFVDDRGHGTILPHWAAPPPLASVQVAVGGAVEKLAIDVELAVVSRHLVEQVHVQPPQ